MSAVGEGRVHGRAARSLLARLDGRGLEAEARPYEDVARPPWDADWGEPPRGPGRERPRQARRAPR